MYTLFNSLSVIVTPPALTCSFQWLPHLNQRMVWKNEKKKENLQNAGEQNIKIVLNGVCVCVCVCVCVGGGGGGIYVVYVKLFV